jgi:DNA-binding GntR family transcriptional regulator
VVQSLLAEVFQGHLRAGQHLVTQALADRFGVSHTPIREALITLAGVGIVDLLPNRGAVVRPVTAREIREICQVRKILECQAARSACGRTNPEALRSLHADLSALLTDRGAIAEVIVRARELDTRLHDLIASSCGNAFLAKELSRLKLLFRAFRDVTYIHHEALCDFSYLHREANEHLAVVEAVQGGDPRQASRVMARHIRSGVLFWTRAMPRSVIPTVPDKLS